LRAPRSAPVSPSPPRARPEGQAAPRLETHRRRNEELLVQSFSRAPRDADPRVPLPELSKPQLSLWVKKCRRMGQPQSLRKIDEEFSLQLQSDPRRFTDSKGKLTLNPLGGNVFFFAEPGAFRSNQPYGLLEFEG
ncbi:hypothetical protein PanWU01x14_362640, partial [Parasponia andersonii]